jgi:hypothetical protein
VRAVAVLDDAAADDHVGVVGIDDRRVVTVGGQRKHDVATCQRAEVVHQGVRVVAGLEEYEPALAAQFGRAHGDFVGELAVGQPPIRGEHFAASSPCDARCSTSRSNIKRPAR